MIWEALLAELEAELGGTRVVLALVPEQHTGFRPHPKSWTLGELALHVANVLTWLPITLRTTELDLDPPGGPRLVPAKFESAAANLRAFEQHAAAARTALAGASEADLALPWTLKKHGQAMFTLPRAACIRSFVLNHLIHHRGQLTVYLRLCDVPLPPLYGPTADVTGDQLAAQARAAR
jgi:uncharacterized damage-inducible protein DinB